MVFEEYFRVQVKEFEIGFGVIFYTVYDEVRQLELGFHVDLFARLYYAEDDVLLQFAFGIRVDH